MLPSELTHTIEHFFIVYVHRNEAHFTYIYVYQTNVFAAGDIYKNPPPNVISYIFFAIFFALLTARALTDSHLPATASNVCAPDAWLGGIGRVAPPPKILATPVQQTCLNVSSCWQHCHNLALRTMVYSSITHFLESSTSLCIILPSKILEVVVHGRENSI